MRSMQGTGLRGWGGVCRVVCGLALGVVLPAALAAADTELTFTRTTSTCNGLLTNGYTPATTLTVTVTISKTGTGNITALGLTETVPAGWTFGSASGPNAPNLSPAANATGNLDFAWFAIPAFPATFSYTLNPPANATGERCISGRLEYRLGGPAVFSPQVQSCLAENAVCPQPTPCVTYTRALPAAYEAGAPVSVTLTVNATCGTGLEALTLEETVPASWSLSGAVGAQASLAPGSGTLLLVVNPLPTFPATVTYTLLPPANATGVACFSGRALHTVLGTELSGAQGLPQCIPGPPCLRFTRDEIPCPVPGTTFDVTVNLEDDCATNLTALALSESLPAGWTATLPPGGSNAPNLLQFTGDTQTWDFVWFSIPPRPFSFTYRVAVPEGDTAAFALSGRGEYRTGGPAEFTSVVAAECLDAVQCTLSLLGTQTISLACGTTFIDPGVSTQCDRPIPPDYQVVTVGAVNTGQPGPYNLRYELRNGDGDVLDAVSRVVNITDTVPPTITLTGPANQQVQCGSAYTDPGATANDVCAGNLTAQIVASGAVNTAVPGVYTRTYNVSDPSGNAAAPVTRTVTVVDGTAPVITLTGQATIILPFLTPYVEPGFTATDACAGNLTAQVVVTGTVNSAEAGIYTLNYSVADPAGNVGTAQRTVIVNPGPPPTLTVNGDNPLTIECGQPFVDPGATATDVLDGDISAQVVATGTVNTAQPGLYAINYRVANSRGQETGPIVRAIIVSDTQPPTVTLNGAADVTVECGDAYADAGATAIDLCGGDVSDRITVGPGTLAKDTLARVFKAGENYVNTGVPGVYRIAFQASDSAGNLSAVVERTVTVADTTPPTLTLNGAAAITLACGAEFLDPGATAEDACAGDLGGAIVVEGAVDTDAPGVYTLTYRVADPSGNEAVETRTVTVVDNDPPTLTLLGPNPFAIECGGVFEDPGFAASDVCDTSAEVTIGGDTVDTGVEGSYFVTYTARDAAGNVTTRTREVVVLACPGEGEPEGEGEGEGGEEGEGEPDPCVLNPVAGFGIVTPAPDTTFLQHDNAQGVEIVLASIFDFLPGCGGPVVVTYEINGRVAGTSSDIEFGFPIAITRGIGEYVVLATARAVDYGFTVAAATTFRVKRGLDADSNGYLDDPFQLDPETTWRATVGADDGNRTVAAAAWDGTAKDDATPSNTWTKQSEGDIGLFLANPDAPGQTLSVAAPRGLLREGERGVLLVALASTPGRLLAPADTTALEATLPDAPIPGAAYFDISVIVSADGGNTFIPLPPARLAANPVRVTLTGLDPDPDAIPGFFRYPTQVVRRTATGIEVVPGTGPWSNRDVRNIVRGDDHLGAELAALSAFAPIEQANVPPRLSISPDPAGNFNFGEIVVGTSVTHSFDVTNIGGLILSGAASLADPAGVFSLEGATAYALANGESARVTLRFAPAGNANYVATLRFEGAEPADDIVIEVIGSGRRKLVRLFGCGLGDETGFGAGDALLIALLGLGLCAGARARRRAGA